ncbi:unnamed protein product [Brassica rapa subsp. narinosa]|uniref:(rape) hypothetical protein n=1 Tax=Brassica napus TaxID=3708 RepID=A0A816XS07_BRANA|nr:unnamed protein product [Brassica napus]
MRNSIGYSSLSLSPARLKPPQSLSADIDPKMKQSFMMFVVVGDLVIVASL